MVEFRDLGHEDAAALLAFFRRIPERDRTFFKEDVSDEATVHEWVDAPSGHRLVAVEDGTIIGYAAVVPGLHWSSHVAELRVVVDPDQRRRGIGHELARQGVAQAVDMGMIKVIVEVVAEHRSAISLFESLGFEPEAVLRRHIRDREGELHDLMMLSFDETLADAGPLAGLVSPSLSLDGDE